MKLQNYTLRYFVVALLAVIALWATLFYMFIVEEVYDNIDDGLKNSKLLIIREAEGDKTILNTPDFGINQYTILPLTANGKNDLTDHFYDELVYMEYDEDNEPMRILQTVFVADEKPYQLTIRASMLEEDELMEDIAMALIALYFMLAISIGVINHLILKKAWKSFYITLNRLKNFRLGNGRAFKAPETPVTEFKVLGKELEELLKRNEETFYSQKEFIENASHELQTPLAISLNKLELFSQNNTLEEDQLTEIGKISDTLQRLVRMNKSLLMLSKIENRQFKEEEQINFNNLVTTIKDDFSDLAEFKGVKIEVEENANIAFKMNAGLANVMVSNLIKNAVNHNYSGGNVKITVHRNKITVSNTSNATGLDPDKVFSRFYKAVANEKSTGLGLAIVKSIATHYGIRVNYTFTGIHNFTVKFE